MSRLEDAFRNKPIFMPYYPLGYPELGTSIDVIEALARNGADLMEVGLSFSDPLADGPVIQKATQIALENGITVQKSLQAVAELRRRGVQIPLVLMGYYNPMLAYGLERFVNEARSAGADGFIIPDLPLEEAAEFEFDRRGTAADPHARADHAGRAHGSHCSPCQRFHLSCQRHGHDGRAHIRSRRPRAIGGTGTSAYSRADLRRVWDQYAGTGEGRKHDSGRRDRRVGLRAGDWRKHGSHRSSS